MASTLTGPEPHVLNGTAGPLFALHYPAAGTRSLRAVLVLPPFAEELNKSRRMLALAAYALQRAALDVLHLDLYGTGDSGGDFADATLACWRDDLRRAATWLADRGITRLDVLAIRGGALLLADFKPPAGVAHGHVVLWQPVVSGKMLVAQFLRLRVAEGMTGSERATGRRDGRSVLETAGRVEIAGYEITRDLALRLEEITDPLAEASGWQSWSWLEVTAPGASGVGPAAQHAIARLRARGAEVDEGVVEGAPFWATPEIATVPALIDATVRAFAERAS